MRVHVAFTPDEAAAAPTGVVIDVIRATSTICQALAAGYERVSARPRSRTRGRSRGDGVTLGGERLGVRIEGFDLGNSPREYLEPRAPTLAMSTTNGTRAIVTAAERCERVYIASLLNLAAVTEAARAPRRRTSRSSAPASRARSRSTTPTSRAAIAEGLGVRAQRRRRGGGAARAVLRDAQRRRFAPRAAGAT